MLSDGPSPKPWWLILLPLLCCGWGYKVGGSGFAFVINILGFLIFWKNPTKCIQQQQQQRVLKAQGDKTKQHIKADIRIAPAFSIETLKSEKPVRMLYRIFSVPLLYYILNTVSPPTSSSPPFLFRKGQASHEYQQNICSMSSCSKIRLHPYY